MCATKWLHLSKGGKKLQHNDSICWAHRNGMNSCYELQLTSWEMTIFTVFWVLTRTFVINVNLMKLSFCTFKVQMWKKMFLCWIKRIKPKNYFMRAQQRFGVSETDWWSVQAVPHLSPMVAGIGATLSMTPNWVSGWKWIDGWNGN